MTRKTLASAPIELGTVFLLFLILPIAGIPFQASGGDFVIRNTAPGSIINAPFNRGQDISGLEVNHDILSGIPNPLAAIAAQSDVNFLPMTQDNHLVELNHLRESSQAEHALTYQVLQRMSSTLENFNDEQLNILPYPIAQTLPRRYVELMQPQELTSRYNLKRKVSESYGLQASHNPLPHSHGPLNSAKLTDSDPNYNLLQDLEAWSTLSNLPVKSEQLPVDLTRLLESSEGSSDNAYQDLTNKEQYSMQPGSNNDPTLDVLGLRNFKSVFPFFIKPETLYNSTPLSYLSKTQIGDSCAPETWKKSLFNPQSSEKSDSFSKEHGFFSLEEFGPVIKKNKPSASLRKKAYEDFAFYKSWRTRHGDQLVYDSILAIDSLGCRPKATLNAKSLLGNLESKKISYLKINLYNFSNRLSEKWSKKEPGLKWKTKCTRNFPLYIETCTMHLLAHVRLISESYQPNLFTAESLMAVQFNALKISDEIWEIIFFKEGQQAGHELGISTEVNKIRRALGYEFARKEPDVQVLAWLVTEAWMKIKLKEVYETLLDPSQKLHSEFKAYINDRALIIASRALKNWNFSWSLDEYFPLGR
ncbi:hypothetical protein O181_018805 [Austropuccinia psidii MF-1]|uniref:Uncharacterized protein n=1 Tax=Austropuccinia psidii MF-1 TaxID=1389203 RepID=A0A9Q3C9D5_9BASI|nr:hypothetical protein [Austropuccinia psidii MF-1]